MLAKLEQKGEMETKSVCPFEPDLGKVSRNNMEVTGLSYQSILLIFTFQGRPHCSWQTPVYFIMPTVDNPNVDLLYMQCNIEALAVSAVGPIK